MGRVVPLGVTVGCNVGYRVTTNGDHLICTSRYHSLKLIMINIFSKSQLFFCFPSHFQPFKHIKLHKPNNFERIFTSQAHTREVVKHTQACIFLTAHSWFSLSIYILYFYQMRSLLCFGIHCGYSGFKHVYLKIITLGPALNLDEYR